MPHVYAAARLDRLPLASFHRRLLALVSLGVFFDSFDTSLGGTVLSALLHSGWSTLELNAHFISATFIGISCGVFIAGVVGDRLGRRFSYQFNLLVFGLASFAAALAPSMPWLIAIRFVMGLGLGAEFVVGYSLITEFMPPHYRGRAVSVVAFFSLSAALVSALLSFLIIPSFGWRWLFVIAGVGAVIAWYLRKDLPESPRWLEAAGRSEQAESVLRAIEAEVARAHTLPPPAASAPPASTAISIGVLFSRPVVKRTLLAMLVNIVIGFGTYGFITWLPTFFVKEGFGVSDALRMNTIIQFGAPLGPLLGIWLADRIGRRNGIIWGGVCAALLALAFPFETRMGFIIANGLLLNTFVLGLLVLGVGSYTPELFPTEFRMRGNGVAQLAGRLTTILSPYLVLALYQPHGVLGVAVAAAAMFLAMALATALARVETRLKPLESIGAEAQGAPLAEARYAAPRRGPELTG
ncbi:MAG TPA: MFS transporter [Stellaceae bacterium]|nr:MFS transporter [Stellaceae bacterium]